MDSFILVVIQIYNPVRNWRFFSGKTGEKKFWAHSTNSRLVFPFCQWCMGCMSLSSFLLYLPPAYVVYGKTMVSVMSVCPQERPAPNYPWCHWSVTSPLPTTWTCPNLFTSGPPPPKHGAHPHPTPMCVAPISMGKLFRQTVN